MVHWNKYRFFVIHKPLLNDTDMFVHVTSCLFYPIRHFISSFTPCLFIFSCKLSDFSFIDSSSPIPVTNGTASGDVRHRML